MINRKLTYQNFCVLKEVSLKKGIGVEKKCCRYTYDALNRITSATDNTGHYNLTSVTYDKNGNIKTLDRKGDINTTATLFGNMDLLKYYYQPNSNKLKKVLDTSGKIQGFKDGANVATEYTYDQNGNMLRDYNKGITSNIIYNYLNLPTEIKFNNSNTKKINYTYDATGTKLRKVVNDNGSITTTDYAGNFVYENNTLKQITQPEGYIEPNGSNYLYVYQYTDIWGNTRLTYADSDGNGTIAQNEIRREQNYYPFGLEHRGYNSTIVGAKNNLKTYQKQEFTEDLDLNTHEWKFRISDPSIGRFWQVDPLAEKYTYNSTYAFQENKLGIGIELEGLEVTPFDMNKVGNGTPEMEKFRKENPKTTLAIGAGAIIVPLVMLAAVEAGATSTATFIGNEIKDEILSQATGGASDVFDLTKIAFKGLKKLSKLGFKKLDIGGGALSKYSDALNIDPNAKRGIKGTLSDFVSKTKGNIKFEEIVVDNPQVDFLGDAVKVLDEGGTITVRGTMSNPYFNKIVNGKAKGLDGFKVSDKMSISNKGFTKTNGDPIKGQMFEVVLTQQ